MMKLDMLQIGKLVLHLTLSVPVLFGQVFLTVTTFTLLHTVSPFAALTASMAMFVTVRAGNKAFMNELAGLLFKKEEGEKKT